MQAADFDYIARLIKDEAGITLERGKEYLVTSRLDPVAKSLGYPDIAALVLYLRNSGDEQQRRQLVESLTTHETSFFRDREPFEALRSKIIPDLIEKQKDKRELAIWCGAASSGQEPYSLCMLIREEFPQLKNWKIDFVATDISRQILDRCETGVYSQMEVNRGLPVKLLVKYFDQKGSEWIVKPELRSMVSFKELNLLRSFAILPRCDLVLLRNVLIYFDVPTKREILEKVARTLKPHGVMLLGTAESTLSITDRFERMPLDRANCYTVRPV